MKETVPDPAHQLLVCPRDHALLQRGEQELACTACGAHFPFVEGIPVFNMDEEWDALYQHERTHYAAAAPFQLAPGERGPLYHRDPARFGVVLDLGCGDGVFASAAPAETPVYCVDVTLTGLRRLLLRRQPNLVPIAGSGFELPFPDAAFDTVLYVFVVEHLAPGDDERMLREIRRVLKPDGRLIYTTDTPFYDRRLVPWANRIFRRGPKAQDFESRTGHINLLTMRASRALVARAGFAVEREIPCWMGSRLAAWSAGVRAARRVLPRGMAEDLLTSSYTFVLRRAK